MDGRHDPPRRRTLLLGAALAPALALGCLAPSPAVASPRTADRSTARVIVEGGGAAAAARVVQLGGLVERRLAIVDGLQARLPASALPALAKVPGVRSVTVDSALHAADERWGDDTTDEGRRATRSTGRWDADHDLGSAYSIAKVTGAENVWSTQDPNDRTRTLTGAGVGVALIDTGVTPVEGLSTPGKVVNGPDLSLDSQVDNTRHLDGYGHGTHMAGLIAGRDSATTVGGLHDKKHFVGMAPDATLVNVKVGAYDGSVDVSQVIAGIDWVVANKASRNIRVLNLSYGTESAQPARLDPLAHAVENAWRAGIVVVVAAGNDGESGPRPLTMPAVDPFVIAVGSSDHHGVDNPTSLTVGSWTNSGTTDRRPDLVAPGKSVVSLRVPGSLADVGHPEGLVPGDTTGRLFRGTGTSQSAAVVSGAAALLLQRDPRLTPDQVKGVLRASADALRGDSSPTQGAGLLDVKGAVALLSRGPVGSYAQQAAASTGTGSLDAARGGSRLVDPATGAELTGERDLFGVPWDATAWAAASSAHRAWSGGSWRGTAWTGSGWSDGSWPAVPWTRTSWTGLAWADRPWTRMSWRADDWSRMSWRGDDWSRMSWRADDWSRMSWRVADHW